MIVLLTFAFISGLFTILAPCIWPLLPIILSSSTTGGKQKALGITLGITISFAILTLSISYIVTIFPFDPNIFRLFAVIVIGFFGIMLLFPSFSSIVEGYMSKINNKLGSIAYFRKKNDNIFQGLVTGIALGVIWSPCAGPILATIATLAATRAVSFQLVIVTVVYVAGIGIPFFIFTLFGNWLFTRSRFFSKYTGRLQQLFGIIMIITAIATFTNYDKIIQAKLLNFFPEYSNFLFKLEGNAGVQTELQKLKGNKSEPFPTNTPLNQIVSSGLPVLGKAPDFTGITQWLNDQNQKPTIRSLRGKVVLIDFWTYTCINCLRTLPFVTSWYDKYKDKGFVVIGVHTPEFEFEKNTQNVQNAIRENNIHYPVAQDNNYETWNAYSNQYWPAEYLIDAQGNIRHVHFGEGEYDQTEMAIQKLIQEAGKQVKENLLNMKDQTPQVSLTPETYLGSKRMERFASLESVVPQFQNYQSPSSIPTDNYALNGNWNVQPEYVIGKKGSVLLLHFKADKVFLVIHPSSNNDRIKVMMDNKDIDVNEAGKDLQNGIVNITEPRLYELINLKDNSGDHLLKLELQTDGTQLFAFTFG